jgi:hypothetical protein
MVFRVSENLSILFLLERSGAFKDGRAPIFAGIMLNGQHKEISPRIKSLPNSGTMRAAGYQATSRMYF